MKQDEVCNCQTGLFKIFSDLPIEARILDLICFYNLHSAKIVCYRKHSCLATCPNYPYLTGLPDPPLLMELIEISYKSDFFS